MGEKKQLGSRGNGGGTHRVGRSATTVFHVWEEPQSLWTPARSTTGHTSILTDWPEEI